MRIFFGLFLAGLMGVSAPLAAQDIAAGSRITVTSDWHSKNGGPYRPTVSSCNSNSGLCLVDANTSPSQNLMIKTGSGLQVVFKDFGVVYLFRPNGKGSFHDMSGKKTGDFAWSQ